MVSERLKKYWSTLGIGEQHRLLKEQTNNVYKAYVQMENASQKEFDHGLNRTGIRGGKLTTIIANTQKKSEIYYSLLEELKYMTSQL